MTCRWLKFECFSLTNGKQLIYPCFKCVKNRTLTDQIQLNIKGAFGLLSKITMVMGLIVCWNRYESGSINPHLLLGLRKPSFCGFQSHIQPNTIYHSHFSYPIPKPIIQTDLNHTWQKRTHNSTKEHPTPSINCLFKCMHKCIQHQIRRKKNASKSNFYPWCHLSSLPSTTICLFQKQ